MNFLRGSENGLFPKGLVNGFCPKIELFLIAVVHRNCVQKNRLFNILDRKQSIQDQKIEVLTRVKKMDIF